MKITITITDKPSGRPTIKVDPLYSVLKKRELTTEETQMPSEYYALRMIEEALRINKKMSEPKSSLILPGRH